MDILSDEKIRGLTTTMNIKLVAVFVLSITSVTGCVSSLSDREFSDNVKLIFSKYPTCERKYPFSLFTTYTYPKERGYSDILDNVEGDTFGNCKSLREIESETEVNIDAFDKVWLSECKYSGHPASKYYKPHSDTNFNRSYMSDLKKLSRVGLTPNEYQCVVDQQKTWLNDAIKRQKPIMMTKISAAELEIAKRKEREDKELLEYLSTPKMKKIKSLCEIVGLEIANKRLPSTVDVVQYYEVQDDVIGCMIDAFNTDVYGIPHTKVISFDFNVKSNIYQITFN